MRKYWPTIAIAVIFIALLVYVILTFGQKKSSEQNISQVLFQTEVKNISSLEVVSNKSNFEVKNIENKIVLLNKENQDAEMLAIQTKAQELIDGGSKIQYDTIVSQNEKNFEQFGLSSPKTVKVNLKDGTNRIFEIGNMTPLNDGYYLKEKDKSIIYKSSTLDNINKEINDIVDKKILSNIDITNVDKLIVSFKNQTSTFENKNGQWTFDGIILKQDKINAMSNQLKDLSVDGVPKKDAYININAPSIMKLLIYKNGVEAVNLSVIPKDEKTYNVIKQGVIPIQYYISSETFEKDKNDISNLLKQAINQ